MQQSVEHRKGEQMKKSVLSCRRRLILGLAGGLMMFLLGQGESRAGIVITMTVDALPPVNLIAFTTPLATDPGQLNNYGTVDLTAINTFLSGANSAYTFTSLGGSSNFSGAPVGGSLSLTGGLTLTSPGGSTSLVLNETETGFTSPVGPFGTLASTSQGNFSFAGPPNAHGALSSFNGLSTQLYTVASTIPGVGPDHEQNGITAHIPSFITPYSLTNTIEFSLVPGAAAPTDNFNVVAGVTAIPEPASVVMMLLGLPCPLVCLAWVRRLRAAATT
jgi:hypothetical protein